MLYLKLTHRIRIVAGISLILAIVAAALPQPVKAASCMKYYTVKEGEKRGEIAAKFDVKWIEIAKANDLEAPYELEAGQVLCIPFPYSVTLKNNLAVRSINNSIRVSASDFPKKSSYTVKARDITNGPGEWYELGKLKVKSASTATGSYILPKALRSSIYLQVCLKEGTTDKLTCKTVRHTFQ
jgi:LysM repeat protein